VWADASSDLDAAVEAELDAFEQPLIVEVDEVPYSDLRAAIAESEAKAEAEAKKAAQKAVQKAAQQVWAQGFF
jgi:fatty acid-binding protein DegV